jgi:hypothetical protein
MGDFSYLGKLSYFINLNPVAMAGDDFPTMIPLGKIIQIIQVFMVRFSEKPSCNVDPCWGCGFTHDDYCNQSMKKWKLWKLEYDP